ncbi:hypothetical protein ATN79_47465 [Paraburkholderia caribensis]|nr:hypothetical protein ATN79_47465 [Paraburkholderia caribensis]
MFETLVSFIAVEQLAGRTFIPPLGDSGYARVMSPHRRPYRTLDGYIDLLPYTTAQWQRFLLQVGTNELLLDDAVRLAARARDAEVDVILDVTADVPHVFQAFTGMLDEADYALDRAALFIVQRLAR